MKKPLLAALLATCIYIPNVSAEAVDLKLWMRADKYLTDMEPSVHRATESLNAQLKQAGDDRQLNVEIHFNRSRGWDEDVLQYLRSDSVNRGADIYVGAHEWLASLAEANSVMALDEYISQHPSLFGDMIDWVWPTVTYKQQRWGIPFLPEARMVFFNKNMLRSIGKSEEFIAALPERVDRGEFTIYDLSALTKEVMDAGKAKYGILHRPNTGPDFLMNMRSFGYEAQDPETGKLVVNTNALTRFLTWIKANSQNNITPSNNTTMSWDAIHRAFGEGDAFVKIHGIWGVPQMIDMGISDNSEQSYFENVGWMNIPSAEQGARPFNMSHPLTMSVNPKAEDKELAIRLIGEILKAENYTPMATGAGYLAIHNKELTSPEYKEAWISRNGSELLTNSDVLSMPIHPSLAKYNDILFRGIQGVETGRLTADKATDFVVERMRIEMADDVIIK
ncbi:extracellular solute-binding protein [Photobacterium makurazakiensis]|uniref:sugar ABC transporter substrate-binding protein n=1 Tax=Photobacterium makurazakiensis TaxID=2910234 RepID=UPI003D0D266F